MLGFSLCLVLIYSSALLSLEDTTTDIGDISRSISPHETIVVPFIHQNGVIIFRNWFNLIISYTMTSTINQSLVYQASYRHSDKQNQNIIGFYFPAMIGNVTIKTAMESNSASFAWSYFPEECTSKYTTNNKESSFDISLSNEMNGAICYFNAHGAPMEYAVNYQIASDNKEFDANIVTANGNETIVMNGKGSFNRKLDRTSFLTINSSPHISSQELETNEYLKHEIKRPKIDLQKSNFNSKKSNFDVKMENSLVKSRKGFNYLSDSEYIKVVAKSSSGHDTSNQPFNSDVSSSSSSSVFVITSLAPKTNNIKAYILGSIGGICGIAIIVLISCCIKKRKCGDGGGRNDGPSPFLQDSANSETDLRLSRPPTPEHIQIETFQSDSCHDLSDDGGSAAGGRIGGGTIPEFKDEFTFDDEGYPQNDYNPSNVEYTVPKPNLLKTVLGEVNAKS